MCVVRVGIVGLGGAAERIHLPALHTIDQVEVVGGADSDPLRRAAALGAGVPRAFDRAETLIEATQPDVIVIATPPASHRDLCLLALDAGCHVFCEKPFVMSVTEADEVVAAADRAGRLVAVNNQYRQMLIYRKTRAAIARGLFGKPYLLQVWQQMNLPPEHDPPWRAAMSRRILFEFATHAIDLVSFLFGGWPAPPIAPGYPPDQPYAVSARTPMPLPGQDADLISVVRLDLAGARSANLIFNRRSQAPQKYLEMRLDCERASIRLSLGGVARLEVGWNSEAGRPRFRSSLVRGGEVRVERDGRSRVLAREPHSPFSPATGRHFRRFLDAIEHDRVPEGSARSARELIRTVFAAYQSADRGGELVRVERPGDQTLAVHTNGASRRP
ncbi:MAG: Gfo/Idh/MocA family oxidoreductase [Dehalococcoidia bacterium]